MTLPLDDLVRRIRGVEVGQTRVDVEELLTDLEAAVRLPGGPRRIVDAFGSSTSTVVLRSLSFVLAGIAGAAQGGNLPVLLGLVDDLTTDDASTLINTFTALKRYRLDPAARSALGTHAAGLAQLVERCLCHRSDLVVSGALDYLAQLAEDDQMPWVAHRSEESLIEEKLRSICESGRRELADSACALLNTSGQHRTS